MPKEFGKDFQSKCASDTQGACHWSCNEIDKRFREKADRTSTYTKKQMNQYLASLQAQVGALGNNQDRVIIGSLTGIPVPEGNSGIIFINNDTWPYEVYVSDGITWQLIFNCTACEDGSSGSGGTTTSRRVLTGTRQLTTTDAKYQFLDPGGLDRNVILSNPPRAGDKFVIKNLNPNLNLFIKEALNGASVFTLTGAISSSEFVHDGVEWHAF